MRHVRTQGTLACEPKSTQSKLTRDHVSTQDTLARENVSTQGMFHVDIWAREHARYVWTRAHKYARHVGRGQVGS